MKWLAGLSLTVGLLSVPIQAQTEERPLLRNPLEGIEQQATKRPVLRNPLEGIEQQAREAEARRMFEEAEQNRMIENARRREPGQNAALIAPIQVQAQTGCVTFPQNANPEAEVRYLTSHPSARVCASAHSNPAGQAEALRRGAIDRANAHRVLQCSLSGRVCW
jgi:hypothetical protein